MSTRTVPSPPLAALVLLATPLLASARQPAQSSKPVFAAAARIDSLDARTMSFLATRQTLEQHQVSDRRDIRRERVARAG
jgi:hypothetical protein